jgi:type I restriction enzyme, R subunit
VFTQDDARDFVKLLAEGNDATIQGKVAVLREKFTAKIADPEQRKEFVYLLARFVRSYHFLTCFFAYSEGVKEFAIFAEYVGPQLIKQGSVSELMKQIRETEVTRASVAYKGEFKSGGTIKVKSGTGKKGGGLPPAKVTVQSMIDEIREKFAMTDEEALYIREVTEEKTKDEEIRATVQSHKDDVIYLRDVYAGQVNKVIQSAYYDRERYSELIDPKYIEAGAIFDIMAYTVKCGCEWSDVWPA